MNAQGGALRKVGFDLFVETQGWAGAEIHSGAAMPWRKASRAAGEELMRRLLKEIAAGGAVKGDVTTLEDLNVIASLQSSSSEES